jgi:hypothetical protein
MGGFINGYLPISERVLIDIGKGWDVERWKDNILGFMWSLGFGR